MRQLTHTGAYAGSPVFSHDGKQIAFYSGSFQDVIAISDPRRLRATTQIAVINVDGSGEHPVTRGAGEKWSPRWITSETIGYTSGGPESGLEFTTDRKGVRGEFNSPAWSADGKRMVFHRDTAQGWPPVMPVPSRDPKFRLLRAGIFPSFSPAGDRVAFTTGFSAFLHNGLMVTSADGTNRWLVHDDLEHNTVAPSWSPRGDLIAFGSGGGFQGSLGQSKQISNIAVVAPDGSGFRLLTKTEGTADFPAGRPMGVGSFFACRTKRARACAFSISRPGGSPCSRTATATRTTFPHGRRRAMRFPFERSRGWRLGDLRDPS